MYSTDPFSVQPARIPQARPQRLTEEDVERRRQLLQDLGQENSLLGRVNDWKGAQVAQRDAMQSALRQSAVQSVATGAASL